MTIEIEKRLWNDFTLWAQANNMSDDDMQKYVIKAFRDKFNLDKYGDLNDKIKKPEPVKKTRTTTKKKKVDDVNHEPQIQEVEQNEPINEPNDEPNDDPNRELNEGINDGINEGINEGIKPAKKKTKVLKSK